MEEPWNVDHFYMVLGTIEVDGKRGYGKVKKWYDEKEKKFTEKIVHFSPYNYGDKDE